MIICANEKVIIRHFTEADITTEYLSWLNDQDLMKFSNQRFKSHDRGTALRYLRTFEHSQNAFFAITSLEGVLVGTMTAYKNENHQTIDMGILIGKPFTGSGLGKSAWLCLFRELENDPTIRKITAGCAHANLAMIKLIEGVGMQLEGRRKHQELYDGELIDILLYGKLIR